MVALNLLNALQLDKYEIIGVSTRFSELDIFGIEIITPETLLSENRDDFDNFEDNLPRPPTGGLQIDRESFEERD